MKPVAQTRFGNDKLNPDEPEKWGNCLPACVASILEIDVDEVPSWFGNEGSWFLEMETWLRERGIGVVVEYIVEPAAPWYVSPGLYGIATGTSPRGDWNHSVVVDHDGMLAHDPNPAGGGIQNFHDVMFLVPLGVPA